ncbi:MAG TPA: hypothetical protein VGQ87_00595 [Patescibacteria group bacterium]|nr:hypothetical protein [Patescibacteria group bacterium]
MLAIYVAGHIFSEPSQEEVFTAILKAADTLPKQSSGPSWFIERDVPVTEVAFDDIETAKRMTARLNLALTRNAAVPQVAQLQQMFVGHIQPTFFTGVGGGASRITSPDEQEALKNVKDPRMMEVVIYGRFAYTHPKINRRLLFYDQEWRAFFMAALNFTDEAWFDAIVGHEFWHAKMDKEGAASAHQAMYSDLWVSEELDAHGVERDVLSLQTKGQYKQLLNKIVAAKSAKSTRRFLMQCQGADLLLLNGLFKPGLPEEQDQRAAQYLLDLTIAWLAQRYNGQELLEKQIEAYRLLISPQSTNVKVG